jgi:hypothetical protein
VACPLPRHRVCRYHRHTGSDQPSHSAPGSHTGPGSRERSTRQRPAKDPHQFFGPFLEDHGLNFADAALIDDRLDNCEAFQAAGGTPIRYKMQANEVSEVEASLTAWLADSYLSVELPGSDYVDTRSPR